MKRRILFFMFCCLICQYNRAIVEILIESLNGDPDETRNVSELITSKGYFLEEHTVQTADGYLLSLQRIPHGRRCTLKKETFWNKKNQKSPVLLIHGIHVDSTCWILNFPDQSLGFILPEDGYDTWLINTRGSTYSRKHVTYTTNHYEFWNFSFQEVAQYDIPATIDYILQITGQKALYIIGVSQGVTAAFAMLSELPEYNDKVKLYIALGPVTFLGHTTSSVKHFVPHVDKLVFINHALTAGEFPRVTKTRRFLKTKLCNVIAREFCENVLSAVGGLDKQQMNETRFGVYSANLFLITSMKSLVHYAQLVKSKKFRKYDYELCNIIQYHQEEPPDYNLSSIRTPTALFWSPYDKFAHPEDVAILRRQLNSLVFEYQVPNNYGHFDFLLALSIPKLIGEVLLQLLNQY